MPKVSNGLIDLNYQASGKGFPILFLHGFTASLKLWDRVAGIFSTSFRCIRMDLRGHGKSKPAHRDSYSLEHLAADTLAVLNHDEVHQAVVVGHSLGGMIAQHLAAHHPERIAAMVLNSTTCFAPPRAAFEPLIQGAIDLAHMSAKDRAANPALHNSSPLSEDTAWGCGETILKLPRYDTMLHAFKAPALILYGDQDSTSIIEGSKHLAACIPQSTESVILDAGHVPQVTHTEAYTEALSDFLQDLEIEE